MMVSCAGWICWMFVRSLRQECFHHVKNRRIFYQTVKTGLSRTMTAADRLWYLLKETSVCKWTHSADGPNRHHQKVQKVSRLIRIDRINIRKVLTSSETKKTRRSCCDCLALQNNSECFGQIMTSCKKWLKFQSNEHLQVCLWFFPVFSILHLWKNNRFCTPTSTNINCIHPKPTARNRAWDAIHAGRCWKGSVWSKQLDSLLDNCTLYPFCVCLCLFSILKLNVNGAWNGVSVLFRSDRLFSQKGSLSWSCWTLFEVCPETCLGDKNWCASNVLNESIMHSTWQSTIGHNSPQ